ncbi:MAG: ATP-binding cassette domain-containing protein, partial [Oscillospiraceae bacterium]|nr:ATP-binding cassette domain-containing protein [Oscillospiraceae bacterium]
MNEPSVSVKNLTKSFSGRRVVDDLSFDVQKGEVFALLGHNGAGKSTTIDLILGLKAPDGGSAKLLGMDAAKHRKQVFERVGVQLQNTRTGTSWWRSARPLWRQKKKPAIFSSEPCPKSRRPVYFTEAPMARF